MVKRRKIRRRNIDPEDGLENAILVVAVDDYREALINQAKCMESKRTNKEVRKLEKFFRSDWGQTLSHNHGELIISRVKQEVANGEV